ncbi:tyrosine-type recombinase/integrase [Planctomycetota bacterium]
MREPLNGEECNRIINACETFREKLVIWSLLDMVLRVSEFYSLRRKDIHWQENEVVIWGKPISFDSGTTVYETGGDGMCISSFRWPMCLESYSGRFWSVFGVCHCLHR